MPMPKVATKVAIIRSVPSAGNFMAGKLFDDPSQRLDVQLRAEGGDLAREPASLPGQGRLPLGLCCQPRPWQARGVGLRNLVRMPGVGRVVTGDDQRRDLQV